MANQFLALSLFIMMLSFFIILNALSTFEVNKAQPVLNSLATVFSQEDITQKVTPPGQSESFEQSSRTGSVLSRVEALFTAEISGLEARQNRLGTEMIIRMPRAEFQRLVDDALNPAASGDGRLPQDKFSATLVSLLNTQNVQPYRMDIILGLGASPVEFRAQNAEAFNAAASIITTATKRLERAGMPARFMSAGVDKSEADTITLHFRRHVPFNPLGTAPRGGLE